MTRLRVGADAETEVASFTDKATMTETAVAGGGRGATTLRLAYQSAERTRVINKRKESHPGLATVKPYLKSLVGLVELDAGGNVSASTASLARKVVLSPSVATELLQVHEPVKLAVYPLLLPMPNRSVNPMETWKTQRSVAVPAPRPPGSTESPYRSASLELTCTYLGVRNQSGRDEAVVKLEGAVRDRVMAGRGRGLAVVDLSTGTIRSVQLDLDLDMPPIELEIEEGKRQTFRIVTSQSMELKRSL